MADATATETEQGKRWAEAKIKVLTGGDRISARFMARDFFEFQPQFKLIVAGNHKPSLNTVDEAIRRRFNLVPFTHTVPKEDRDPDLTEKLKAEWPGILRWTMEGVRDWLANGLIRPDAIKRATSEYFEDQDVFAQWLDECCRVERDNPGLLEKSTALFGSYSEFARRHGEQDGTQRTFNETMRRRGFVGPTKTRFADGANTKGFAGIQLKKASFYEPA